MFNEATDSETHKTEYAYDADNRVTQVKYDGSDSTKVGYTYDKLNRITQRSVTNGATYLAQYGYAQGATAYGSNATTPLINAITQGSGANALNFSYTYDSRGNITSETRNGVTTTYEYDALGQLTRVNDPNDPTGSTFGTTWIYSYDRGGNIPNKSAYVYTTGTVGTVVRSWAYGYDDPNWKDKLTSFDGHTITYDAIGNPLNDGEWMYEWQAGSRTHPHKPRHKAVNRLRFQYDAQGRAALLDFNGILYEYVHNLQGDIIGILDGNGELAVEYKYDAWGKSHSVLVRNSFCRRLSFGSTEVVIKE